MHEDSNGFPAGGICRCVSHVYAILLFFSFVTLFAFICQSPSLESFINSGLLRDTFIAIIVDITLAEVMKWENVSCS